MSVPYSVEVVALALVAGQFELTLRNVQGFRRS